MSTPKDSEPKLRKAVFVYEDGSIKFVEGDDAQEWDKVMMSALTISYIHGADPSRLGTLNWKTAGPETDPAEILKLRKP